MFNILQSSYQGEEGNAEKVPKYSKEQNTYDSSVDVKRKRCYIK